MNNTLFDTKSLKEISQGTFTPVPKGKTDAEYGYFEYLPPVYLQNNQQFPLIIFLHGAGEVGDNASNPHMLRRVLKHGIPFLITRKLWNPAHPFVVISPQNHVYGWDAASLHRFLEYVFENYNIDRKRVYLTGISMGGFGIFNYLCRYSDKSGIAAAVPICGGGDVRCADNIKNIPLWAFHGDADNVVNVRYSKDIIREINKLNPPLKAKLTIFPKVKHNSWTITYSSKGMGSENPEYDRFDMPIWDWMYRYSLE